jgi:phosphoribosylaminoimidazole carboxylase PurE protein
MEKKVSVVMGSDSDFPIMKEAINVLVHFNISFECIVTSAHRTPERTRKFVKAAEKKGIKAIIVGAGAAAHLAGVIAAETVIPVIGVPIDSSSLKGLDALLSTVQMPGGIPVATMAIGKAGAKNAALFVAAILATTDTKILLKLKEYRKQMARDVEKKIAIINRELKKENLS